jgi:hypothetical protein
MKYSQTFAAVIVALLGWFNLGHLISDNEVGAIIDATLQLGGLLWVIIRRYQAGGVTLVGTRT